jgi:mannitol 2-dehydrogenase
VADLRDKANVTDEWPVMCEPYKHWVIEDNFVDGARPSWEDVGALLVPDVRPHELMKVRMLNVTHSALCYAGVVAGCTHVHEAVTHKMIRPFLKRLMTDEIAASLRADPSMEELVGGLDAYAELVLTRFENVAVKDTLDRIAMDGSEKFRVQGRAVVIEGLADERSVRGFALYVALWAHFLRGAVAAGDKVRDASAALVSAPWAAGGGGLEAFLDIEEVFGVLAQHAGWRGAVGREFEDIADAETGFEATLLGYIFGVGHSCTGGELAPGGGRAGRGSGTFVLEEACVPAELRVDHDDAAAAVEA